MALRFFSLASGSNGNSYYLGTNEYGILLDAGIPLRLIKNILKSYQIDLQQIMAVFITHDHRDHIKAVGGLGKKYNIPIYATEKVHTAINHNIYIKERFYTSRRNIQKQNTILVKDFKITTFDVPHDSIDSIGYCIQYKDFKIVLATDVGHINQTVSKYIRIATHLILESNYDKDMLEKGHYPDFLKQRIMSHTGHLSNTETANFLANNFNLHLKNIWLCHLSKHNNHPDLVYNTIKTAFEAKGICIGTDINVSVLPRTNPSPLFVLN